MLKFRTNLVSLQRCKDTPKIERSRCALYINPSQSDFIQTLTKFCAMQIKDRDKNGFSIRHASYPQSAQCLDKDDSLTLTFLDVDGLPRTLSIDLLKHAGQWLVIENREDGVQGQILREAEWEVLSQGEGICTIRPKARYCDPGEFLDSLGMEIFDLARVDFWLYPFALSHLRERMDIFRLSMVCTRGYGGHNNIEVIEVQEGLDTERFTLTPHDWLILTKAGEYLIIRDSQIKNFVDSEIKGRYAIRDTPHNTILPLNVQNWTFEAGQPNEMLYPVCSYFDNAYVFVFQTQEVK